MKKSYKILSCIMGLFFILTLSFINATNIILQKGLPFYAENSSSNYYLDIPTIKFSSPLNYTAMKAAVVAAAEVVGTEAPLIIPDAPVDIAKLEDDNILIYGATEHTYKKGIKPNLTTKTTDITRLSTDSVILNDSFQDKYKIGDKITLNYGGVAITRTIDGFIVDKIAFSDRMQFETEQYVTGIVATAIIPYNDVFAEKTNMNFLIDGTIFFENDIHLMQKELDFTNYLRTYYRCESQQHEQNDTVLVLSQGSKHYSQEYLSQFIMSLIIFITVVYTVFTVITDKKSPLFSAIKTFALIALSFILSGVFYAVLKGGIFYIFADSIFLPTLYSLLLLITPIVVFFIKKIKTSKRKNSVEGRLDNEKENN